MLKLVLFVALLASATIEAHRFLKNLHSLEANLPSKLAHKTWDHIRRRRDTALAEKSSEELSSSEEAQIGAQFMKFFISAGWEHDKLEMLSGFLEEMSDTDNNLTVIGWQRVLDADGEIKEIKTIQLVIPPKPEDPDSPSNIVQDEDEDDDGEGLPHGQINEIKEMFEPLDLMGIPGSISYEEFDEEGRNNQLIYLDKDELYAFDDNFAIYNKTAVASAKEVSDFINGLKPAGLGKPSVLKYDVDGKLLVDQSHIKSHMLGSVVDHYRAPANVLREGPEIIARISQQYPREEIPKQLSLYYNKAYPEYKWRVLVDPDHTYVTRDVTICLTYDNFDFDETSDVTYFVYGVKK